MALFYADCLDERRCTIINTDTGNQKETTPLTINVSITDTELFTDFYYLSLWMFRRLPKHHQDPAYKQVVELLGGQFDLEEFDVLRKR